MSDGEVVVVGSETGVTVVDVADASAPRRAGAVDLSSRLGYDGVTRCVRFAGGHAYVVVPPRLETDAWMLHVIDMSDPAAPRQVGTFRATPVADPDPWVHPWKLSLHVADGVAYVADGARLVIVDVRDSTEPRQIGAVAGAFSEVYAVGSLAYVVERSELEVLDVRDPAAPHVLGRSAALPSGVEDVVVAGGHAYLACRAAGLQVVDVRDPSAPTLVGAFDPPRGMANGVDVVGEVAFVADDTALRIVDVSTPSAPRELGALPVGALNVVSDGATAFVGSGNTLRAVDVRDPAAPREVDAFPVPGENSLVEGVGLGEGVATIATSMMGLWVVRYPTVAGPGATPTPAPAGHLARVGRLAGDVPASAVNVADDTAYVVEADLVRGAVAIVDVRDPGAPAVVGRLDPPGRATKAFASGGIAYVAGGPSVPVFDVSAPEAPIQVGEIDHQASDIVVADRYAYCVGAGDWRDLRIYDVSDPRRPQPTGRGPDRMPCDTISVSGRYVYCAMDTDIVLLDVADPESPQVAGRWWVQPFGAKDVDVAAGYAFYVTWGTLVVVDVRDPALPVEVGRIDLGSR